MGGREEGEMKERSPGKGGGGVRREKKERELDDGVLRQGLPESTDPSARKARENAPGAGGGGRKVTGRGGHANRSGTGSIFRHMYDIYIYIIECFPPGESPAYSLCSSRILPRPLVHDPIFVAAADMRIGLYSSCNNSGMASSEGRYIVCWVVVEVAVISGTTNGAGGTVEYVYGDGSSN